MINIILAGVGGQNIASAAKILAVASKSKGWDVSIFDTLGMSQRGGSVLSHIRIADKGKDIHSPLIPYGYANTIIAFEPGEAARALPYLARTGSVITATTPIAPSSTAFTLGSYDVAEIIEGIQLTLYNAMVKNLSEIRGKSSEQAKLFIVDDDALTRFISVDRKTLNSIMLAEAIKANVIPFTQEELVRAVKACVKAKYLDINLAVIEAVFSS